MKKGDNSLFGRLWALLAGDEELVERLPIEEVRQDLDALGVSTDAIRSAVSHLINESPIDGDSLSVVAAVKQALARDDELIATLPIEEVREELRSSGLNTEAIKTSVLRRLAKDRPSSFENVEASTQPSASPTETRIAARIQPQQLGNLSLATDTLLYVGSGIVAWVALNPEPSDMFKLMALSTLALTFLIFTGCCRAFRAHDPLSLLHADALSSIAKVMICAPASLDPAAGEPAVDAEQ